MFRKFFHLISRIPYSKSTSHGIRLVKNNQDYLIDRIFCMIYTRSNKYQFYIRVKCLNPHVTGFDNLDMATLYMEGGFDSFDIAFGELTKQIIKASKEFDSGFYFFDVNNKCLYFDRELNRWINYPSIMFKCRKCGVQVQYDGARAFDMDGQIGFCKICDGYLRQLSS